MSRPLKEVLESGFLTSEEDEAIRFATVLEDNEEHMGEGAAMAVTCSQYGIEVDESGEVLMNLPDGEWWKAEHLPVKEGEEK